MVSSREEEWKATVGEKKQRGVREYKSESTVES